jgi:hypothetical protein
METINTSELIAEYEGARCTYRDEGTQLFVFNLPRFGTVSTEYSITDRVTLENSQPDALDLATENREYPHLRVIALATSLDYILRAEQKRTSMQFAAPDLLGGEMLFFQRTGNIGAVNGNLTAGEAMKNFEAYAQARDFDLQKTLIPIMTYATTLSRPVASKN